MLRALLLSALVLPTAASAAVIGRGHVPVLDAARARPEFRAALVSELSTFGARHAFTMQRDMAEFANRSAVPAPSPEAALRAEAERVAWGLLARPELIEEHRAEFEQVLGAEHTQSIFHGGALWQAVATERADVALLVGRLRSTVNLEDPGESEAIAARVNALFDGTPELKAAPPAVSAAGPALETPKIERPLEPAPKRRRKPVVH